MSAPVPAPEGARETRTSRAPMLPYAAWQFRDYVMERGIPTVLVALLFGFLAAMPVRAAAHGNAAETNARVLHGFVGSIVFLGALFAMNGLVANDRKQGYYRFLFAKPVAPGRYYGQAFVLHAIGFLGVIVLLGTAWSVLVAPALTPGLVIAMWVAYLCYAGIAFLLSAAAKYDWLSLVLVSVAAQFLWERYATSTSIFARLLFLLPPLPRIDSVYRAATMHLPLPWRTLAWLAGYGVACFVAGLVVLRHRRLATP